MSSRSSDRPADESTLSAFDGAHGPAERAETTPDHRSWVPERSTEQDSDHSEQNCRGCGAHVSPDFRRVFGDNDDLVHACPECSSMTDLTNGATVGKEGGH